MKKILFLLPFVLFSCSDESFNDAPEQPADNPVEESTGLTTVNLATFAGDPSRVTYPLATRAEEGGEETAQLGTLELVASVSNPSKAEGFNFTKEEDGRWLSATSVYYDATTTPGTYYATYHMQGNNYNTTLDNEIGGAIQQFTVTDDGEVALGTGFRAENPSVEDFDFNHLYFDTDDNRIIAVGHNVKGGNMKNTNAIVGIFNPAGTYTYSTVKTGEKEYDANGKSLGYKDAGDVNSIIRPGAIFGTSHWNFYLVATRKGMAALDAHEDKLFKPILNDDGTNYFIPTPGSAKSIQQGTSSSYVNLLYLSEDTSEKPEAYITSSEARIAHFSINTANDLTLKSLQTQESNATIFNPQTDDILDFKTQTLLPAVISPVDGKNTLFYPPRYSDADYYAALGTSGMYYKNKNGEGVLKFGDRPVNCVYADTNNDDEAIVTDDGKKYAHDGFLYVANGSKLTILHRLTREEIVSWNMPSKDENGNDIESSANYIVVTKAPKGENGMCERTITVAYGQAGVKIFKFMPTYRILQ